MRRWIVLVACVLLGGVARADEPKAWVAGVSEQEQAAALDLYQQGNVEFSNARFENALELYQQAIQHWDHPAIRYNMAVAYNNLGLLLEADDNLDRALRYGEEPLGAEIYQQGLNYRRNFDRRLARVKISCGEPGTQVSLDGHVMFSAPGSVEKRVLPGEHQIVAAKPGFLTVTEPLDLQPGALKTYDVRLIALKPQTHMERRWDPWKPWAVTGAGAGMFALGGLAYLASAHNADIYDRGIAARCPHGCDAATEATFTDLAADLRRSRIERDLDVSLFILGGATIVAGVAGVVFDAPHAVAERVQVAPLVGGGALTLSGSF